MDIRIVSADCVRIGLSPDECGAMGISYGSFSPASIPARLFIASVLTKLESEGVVSERPQKLTAEVFEDGGGLAVYISGKGLSCRQDAQQGGGEEECFLLLATPAETEKALRELPDGTRAELYSFGKGYALTAQCPLQGGRSSAVLAAAIKEHGRLLSSAPQKLFRD